MPIQVLLVDDHKIVRQGVRAYLQTLSDIEVVAEADSGAAAVTAVERHQPNVVLMDLEMPGELDGIEATRQIRKLRPETQVIVVTSHHQDEFIFPAVRAGAISYLLKDVEPEELAEAIRKAAQGEATLDSRVASRIMKELQGLRKEEINPFTELSEREYEVLQLVAAGKSNAEIAEALVIGESTVKTHIGNLLKKLHLDDRTQAAVYAWQKGIVRRE
ncbi:MAG: DNA-binding response regulator [Anaerolineaceae bacterium]|nr:DNA-binding response regulator [Anaerolineae bacterium]MBL1172918.1 DNA-binding response regulator [Chloroflexota bacterium]MBV6465557.1 Transcriptional regulatory protein LiaR [Anaerolineales bacterium]GJQ37887.1 MAG: DNA-binding response regulator [Anaerolineaceae bacterium]MCL4823708.1 response regulator transcription factor [Anaerolineales bacterium]